MLENLIHGFNVVLTFQTVMACFIGALAGMSSAEAANNAAAQAAFIPTLALGSVIWSLARARRTRRASEALKARL